MKMKKLIPILVCVLVLAGIVCIPFTAQAENTDFYVDKGSEWEYIAFCGEAANEPAAPEGWTTGADSATWSTGAAPFSGPAYSEVSNIIPKDTIFGEDPFVAYIRQKFTIEDASKVERLLLYICYDEDPVVYINGTEVWSTTGYADGGYTEVNLTNYTDLLKTGENMIAVEFKNFLGGSIMDIELIGKVAEHNIAVSKGSVWEDYAYADVNTPGPEGWATKEDTGIEWAIEAAPLTGGNATFVAYARQSFTLEDASAVKHLNLEIKYDEDPIVYINGTEVWSTTGYCDWEYVNVNLTDYIDTLKDGENVLAVCFKNQGGGSVLDLGLYYSEAPVIRNVALNKTAIKAWDGEASVNVTDGLYDNYVDYPEMPENVDVATSNIYWEIDLEKAYVIDNIRVGTFQWEEPTVWYKWQAYGSNDATAPISEWTLLAEKDNETVSNEELSAETSYDVESTEAFRFVRIYGVDSNESAHCIDIQEIEVRSSSVGTTPAPSVNVALDKTATMGWNGAVSIIATNGVIDPGHDCNTIPKEFDINTSKTYFEIDLEKGYVIDAFRVVTADYDYYYKWQAYGSNDPEAPISEWTLLTEKTNDTTSKAEAETVVKYYVESTEPFRYVRVYGLDINEESYHMFHIREIEVYSSSEGVRVGSESIEIEPFSLGMENWGNQTQVLIMAPIPYSDEAMSYTWKITATNGAGTKEFEMTPSSYGGEILAGIHLYRFETAKADKFIPVGGDIYYFSAEIYDGETKIYEATAKSGTKWTTAADFEAIVPEGATTVPGIPAIEAAVEPYGKGWENWSGQTQMLVVLPIGYNDSNKAFINSLDWVITISNESGCSTFTMKLSSNYDWGSSGIFRFQTAADDKFIPVAGEKYTFSAKVYNGTTHLYSFTSKEGKVWEAPADLVPVVPEGAQTTPGLGKHTEETVAGKAATCTETGLTEGKKCSVCGATTVAQEEIAATGHTEETVAGKAPTCTEVGFEQGTKCSVCGEILSTQNEIPATGHTEETVAGKAATCTEAGLTEGKKCSVCGETTVAQEEIAATGHTEKTNEDGSVVCEVCGETLKAPQLGDETVFAIILMTAAILGMAVVFTKKVRI